MRVVRQHSEDVPRSKEDAPVMISDCDRGLLEVVYDGQLKKMLGYVTAAITSFAAPGIWTPRRSKWIDLLSQIHCLRLWLVLLSTDTGAPRMAPRKDR
jgi:hypothetical protein